MYKLSTMRFQFLTLFTSILLLSSCNRNPINKIFDDAKKHDQVFALTIPGWMVHKGMDFALRNDDVSNEIKNLNEVTGGIKKIRLLVNTDNSDAFTKEITAKVNDLSNKHFEPYVMVKSHEANVSMYTKESKDRLKDLFFYVNGQKESAILHVKTDIKISDFEKLSASFKKKDNNEINQKTAE